MIEDLERLRAELMIIHDLPPVLDGETGPGVVRVDDVRAGVARSYDVFVKLSNDYERIAARLARYDLLKRYTRQLERTVAAQRRQLDAVALVATTGTGGTAT